MKTALLAFVVLLQTLILPGTGVTDGGDRAREFDVLHYNIGLSFEPRKRRVFGDSVIHLTPLSKPLNSVSLDAVGLNFYSVMNNRTGKLLKYKYDRKTLTVALGENVQPGARIEIRTIYSATPKKGIYFVKASSKTNRTSHSAQIWTQGESQETSHWLPSFDFPNDKATTETRITVDKGFTVIGNGSLVDKKTTTKGQLIYHHKIRTPHPLYLLSFVVGKYSKVEDRYRDVSLGYYVYPGLEKQTTQLFGRTKRMMAVFEELTGVDYPFEKYDQTIVANFPFGGMENITATTYSDSELLFGPRPSADDLVAHELAHSWFGNNVTCQNWRELWTNEGFASFMEAAFREKEYGEEQYREKIRSDASQYFAYFAASPMAKHGLYNQSADPENDVTMFDPVTYNKGSAVVHTLRREIGDKAFWKGVNTYLSENRLGLVGTRDVQAAFEKASGRDLNWFFEQWVYRVGHPKLQITQKYSKKTGALSLTFTQANTKLEPFYRLSFDVAVKTSQGTTTKKVSVTKAVTEITFDSIAKPDLITIDPGLSIPLVEKETAELTID